jgi:hypothetical protein
MTKHPENILYELKQEVAEKFFAENPLKRFPEDFLSKKVKEEMKGEKSVKGGKGLKGVKSGKGIKRRSRSLATMYRSLPGGRSHQVRHRWDKIDFRKVMELCAEFKKTDAKMKYEIIVLPEGKFELKIDKKIQIRPEKWPMPLEFDYFEAAKYVLYARKKGQCAYNLPKDETIVKKAVKKYETYLKEVRDKLVKAFMARNVDEELAEGFVKLVFEEKLPVAYLAR